MELEPTSPVKLTLLFPQEWLSRPAGSPGARHARRQVRRDQGARGEVRLAQVIPL